MVVELPVSEEDPALEVQAFAATEAGKCSATIDDRVGVEALDKQVVQYIADNAATYHDAGRRQSHQLPRV